MRILAPGEEAVHAGASSASSFERSGDRGPWQGWPGLPKVAVKLSKGFSMTAKENATEILRASEFGAMIIDGKAAAAGVVERVAAEAALLVSRGVKPGLAVVLVGADPASEVYVRSKGRAAEACGFHSVQHTLPATIAEADLIALVERLNADSAITAYSFNCRCPSISTRRKCWRRLLRPRMSTASIR